jgi:hypothetical protein
MFDNSPRTIAQVHSTLPINSFAAIVAAASDQQRKAAKHREIARHYARPRRKRSRPGIVSLILGDLQKFHDDKYGEPFPTTTPDATILSCCCIMWPSSAIPAPCAAARPTGARG